MTVAAATAQPPPRSASLEEHMGLPADFLIGPDGAILAAKYGTYVDDHWSVEDLLALARTRTSAARPQ